MLMVQKYIKRRGLDVVISRLALKKTNHSSLGLYILNYGQIESPKTSRSAQECRCLVLEEGTNSLISKSFSRFFNYGEMLHQQKKFDWTNFVCSEKLDGSLISVFCYKGQRVICTKGTFGDGKLTDLTWDEYVSGIIGDFCPREGETFVFELCSLANKVVTTYASPFMSLLSIFKGENEQSNEYVNQQAVRFKFPRPEVYKLHSIEEMKEYMTTRPAEFEGFVLTDDKFNRIKLKSERYLNLHRTLNNGKPDLLSMVLENEQCEFLLYHPEYKSQVDEIARKVDKMKADVTAAWQAFGHIADQKEFALKVKGLPISSVLFQTKKNHQSPVTNLLFVPNLIEKLLEVYE